MNFKQVKKQIEKYRITEKLKEFENDTFVLSLENIEETYVKYQREVEEYHNINFKSYYNKLIKSIQESIVISNEIITTKVERYTEKYLFDLNDYFKKFVVEMQKYSTNIIERELETTFMELYSYCNNEVRVKRELNKAVSNIYNVLEKYVEIYSEELEEYILYLIQSKAHIIEQGINDCLRTRRVEVEYNSTLFGDEISEQIIFVDNYRELNRIAVENGYVHVRTTGDHGIFKNLETNKIVVIPQGRLIGKGLSMTIQKQIKEGSAFDILKPNTTYIQKIQELQDRLETAKDVDDLMDAIEEYPKELIDNKNLCNDIQKLKEAKIIAEVHIDIHKEDYRSAIQKIDYYINENPKMTVLLALKAACYDLAGNTFESIKYYKEYIKKDGTKQDAYNCLIDLLERVNLYEEANRYKELQKKKFREFLKIKEKITEMVLRGEYKEAINMIEEVEKKSMDNISADFFADVAMSFLIRNEYILVYRYAKKALKMFSEHSVALNLIHSCEKMGVTQEAFEVMDKIYF